MDKETNHPEEVFSFICGDFTRGSGEVKIFKSDNVFTGAYDHQPQFKGSPYWGKGKGFPVSREQMQELHDLLEDVGIEGWFSRYDYPMLDGTPWSITYDSREYGGSNLFPVGFDRIAGFLGRTFHIDEFSGASYEAGHSAKDKPDIDFIVEYRHSFPEADDLESRRKRGKISESAYEDELALIEQTAHGFLCDLSVFVGRQPECGDSAAILERNGIPLERGAIRQQDVEGLDATCIIGMMVALSRMDNAGGHPHGFEECAKDGTLHRWLTRLGEIAGADCLLYSQ
jgi:hypothetical protein